MNSWISVGSVVSVGAIAAVEKSAAGLVSDGANFSSCQLPAV